MNFLFATNSFKPFSSFLLGGISIFAGHSATLHAGDVEYVGDPVISTEIVMGSAARIEPDDECCYEAPFNTELKGSMSRSASEIPYWNSPGASIDVLERFSWGDTEILQHEASVRTVANDLRSPETSWWSTRIDQEIQVVPIGGMVHYPYSMMGVDTHLVARVLVDSPQEVMLKVGRDDFAIGDGSFDKIIFGSLEIYQGHVDPEGRDPWQIGGNFLSEGFDREYVLPVALPAGAWTIRARINCTTYEQSFRNCPSIQCFGHTWQNTYNLVSLLTFRDMDQEPDRPMGTGFILPWDPSFFLQIEANDAFEGDQGGGHGRFIERSIEPDSEEERYDSADLAAWSPQMGLDENGDLMHVFSTMGSLKADGESAGEFRSVKAFSTANFAYDFSTKMPMNFDLVIDGSTGGVQGTAGDDGPLVWNGWNSIHFLGAVYELGFDDKWTEIQPERVAQDGLRIRYELKEGRTYGVNADIELFGEVLADGTKVERCLDQSIKLRSKMRLPGDLTGDGAVDGADLSRLLGDWGTSSFDADIDSNGMVDGQDLAVLLGNWNG